MKRILILTTTARLLVPLLLLFSVFLLLRGHDDPGGGFAGGLVAAAAFVLHALSDGVPEARRRLRVAPAALVAIGMLLAVSAGLVGLARDDAFLTSVWFGEAVPVLGKPGTPLVFDVGVYLVVVGVVLEMAFALLEER